MCAHYIKLEDITLYSIIKALDTSVPPNELLEICELSLEKMGAIFADTNVYMLHMMYQAMGVCLYLQDWDGAMKYGEKIIKPYRYYTWGDQSDCDHGQYLFLHYASCQLLYFFLVSCSCYCSVHYPRYSLNTASMYLKLGRLYLGLEKKSLGVKALKKASVLIFKNLVVVQRHVLLPRYCIHLFTVSTV